MINGAFFVPIGLFAFSYFIFGNGDGGNVAGYLILSFGILFFLLCVNAKAISSPIFVDSNGISWVFYNKKWKTIAWKDLKRVRIYKMYNFALRMPATMFAFDATFQKIPYFVRGGSIFFDETVVGRP